MNINEMFDKVKERAYSMFGLEKISIDPAFFSKFDDEFKNSEVFNSFMTQTGNSFTYVTDRLTDPVIQPIVESYFVFCREKFESLSIDDQVDLAAETFLKNLSYYRGSKLHGVLDGVRKELFMSDIETLFDGDYYADVVFAIGGHFQKAVNMKDIKSNLKKEIARLRDGKKVAYLIREQNCFKYMTCVDTIFKVAALKKEIKTIKVKHGIIEVKENL
jgi:hypothetical protein